MEEAKKKVTDLYSYRDHYFERHSIEDATLKLERVTKEVQETLTLLDQLQEQEDAGNKAELCMLRGKVLNVLPSYDIQAEELLSKAVKLDPKLSEAWLHLGETYWKKKDVEGAKNCFLGALNHGTDKRALRNLSMVLRQIGKTAEERAENVKTSVEKAKEAVQLDITDGVSWYVLGNAYMSLFFASSQNPKIFKQCLSAYQQADKDPIAANQADLHFNRAVANKYQEDYETALNGFHRAKILDPTWTEPGEEETRITSYLSRLQTLVNAKGKLKNKKIQSLKSSLKDSDLGPYKEGTSNKKEDVLEHVPFKDLVAGENGGKVVVGKVVCSVMSEDPVPFTFCMVDQAETCVAVTVYNLANGCGFKVGDSVAIPAPSVAEVNFTYQNETFRFKKIRVNNPVALVVNGKALNRNQQAPTSLSTSVVSDLFVDQQT